MPETVKQVLYMKDVWDASNACIPVLSQVLYLVEIYTNIVTHHVCELHVLRTASSKQVLELICSVRLRHASSKRNIYETTKIAA